MGSCLSNGFMRTPPQIVDLLFGVAATVILGNIFSILVFKTRIY